MRSKDILKHALLSFDGTLIIVSHDRDFLQGLTTKVFEFRNKKVHQYHGDIYDFLSSRKLKSLDELESDKKKKNSYSEEQVSSQKIEYEKRKQTEKEIRKIKTRIEKKEKEIT